MWKACVALQWVVNLLSADVAGAACRPGHWPLSKQSCEVTFSSLGQDGLGNMWFDKGLYLDVSALPSLIPAEIVAVWNITAGADGSSSCQRVFPCSAFALLPYDTSIYGPSGSNYYVFHVDILLPLLTHVQTKMNCAQGGRRDVTVFLFHMLDGAVRLDTDIFDDNDTYWSQAFRLICGMNYIPVSNANMESLIDSKSKFAEMTIDGDITVPVSAGLLCFDHVSFGVPEYSNPSKRSVYTLSTTMRESVFTDCVNMNCWNKVHFSLRQAMRDLPADPSQYVSFARSIDKRICSDNTKRIGLVTRRGRRKILNEVDLLDSVRRNIEMADIRLVDFGRHSASILTEEILNNSATTDFTMRDDLLGIQDLALLIGFQGSGLINGLYSSKVTAVSAIYSSYGWPLASGDPLELLSLRGPYFRHVCGKGKCPMKCEEGSMNDQFCDSGDVIIDPNEFLIAIRSAMLLHEKACSNL